MCRDVHRNSCWQKAGDVPGECHRHWNAHQKFNNRFYLRVLWAATVVIPSEPFPHSCSSSKNLHHAAKSVLCCPPPCVKNNPNLKLQNIVLQFALEVEEVGDGQLPLQICSEEVCCQRRVEAGFQGVPRCRPVSVAHAHAGLGANDALDLKIRGRMLTSKPPLGLILVKHQYEVLQAQMCHPLFAWNNS